MKYCYDLHIHSALSPCADDENTPINILATASAKGLEIIAISDHNSIKNVKVAMEIGEMLDILVVPAMELQTNEDIHILCLFDTFSNLENFYKSINFTTMKNRPEIFGNQLIFDDEDNVIGVEESLLLTSADISEYEICKKAREWSGVAIPAHIDRDSNGMMAILGDIPKNYATVEVSGECTENLAKALSDTFNIIFDSDAHTLEKIGSARHTINLNSKTREELIKKLSTKF